MELNLFKLLPSQVRLDIHFIPESLLFILLPAKPLFKWAILLTSAGCWMPVCTSSTQTDLNFSNYSSGKPRFFSYLAEMVFIKPFLLWNIFYVSIDFIDYPN